MLKTCEHDPCQQKTITTYCFYHAKLADNLITELTKDLTKGQIKAMFTTRQHRDGRRSDQYRKGITEHLEH